MFNPSLTGVSPAADEAILVNEAPLCRRKLNFRSSASSKGSRQGRPGAVDSVAHGEGDGKGEANTLAVAIQLYSYYTLDSSYSSNYTASLPALASSPDTGLCYIYTCVCT